MPPAQAALFGALLAFAVVALALFVRWQIGQRREAMRIEAGPQVSPEVEKVIRDVPVGIVIVGPHDELLSHNDAAVRIGAVRGSRLGYKRLLAAVRDVRFQGLSFDGPVDREPIPGQNPLQLQCRISLLSDDMVLLVAVDDAQSRRVEAVRRDFVANVSHELKTPIGAISVLAEAVESAKDDPEAVERFALRLQRETARLTELVGQIIDLSRLQAADPLLEQDGVELTEVVAESVGRTREQASNRGVNVIVARTTSTLVLGDRWQLADAISNLIQNAINYSDEGARVAISVIDTMEDGEQFVEVKVSDNGIGIKREEQERIFERFYRVDYGRSRSTGGTGLGLSIVRHIVLAHAGSVKVWSNPGQGSTFTLRFPAFHRRELQEEET